MLSNNRKYFFLILIIFTLFTRFFKLNWDSGFSFHPDENNMALSILQMDIHHLNPSFFAYGQFPLYLTFFTTPKHDLTTIALTLRFWSAFFSVLSIIIFYFIGKKVFSSSKDLIIFCLFLIFTPGLIQTAHFGTTESILIFIFSLNLLFSFLIYDHPQKKLYLFLSGLISGIGLATKISALILTMPIFLSLLFLFLKNHQIKTLIIKSLFFILFTILIGVLLSPYNLIKFSDFTSSMKYEIGIANGSIPIFYTRQFINSVPYLFQLKNIFPYTNGIFIFIFGFIGLGVLIYQNFKKNKINPYLLIILFSSLTYFIYQGQLFVKWTRFMSPIFFLPPLLTVFFVQKINNKIFKSLIVFLAILPGAYFMKTYLYPDTRIEATEWINKSLPENSLVLSESGNVTSLPLYDSKINVTDFDFYRLDDSQNSFENLNQLAKNSDFIFIPSRRVFKNQNNELFPLSQQYYQSLFSGQLNYHQLNSFSKSNSFLLKSENAEETWSVFDNPIIRIYTNNEP